MTLRPDHAPSPSNPHLLVVEDNPTTLRLLKRMLDDGEYVVDTAQSVDEALFKAEGGHYDAFILDINLSERRTGIEVLHAIRRMPKYNGVPAVACTAYALSDHQDLFREAGFTAVITKPVTSRLLTKGIQHALEHPDPPRPKETTLYEDMDLPPMPTTIAEVLRLIAQRRDDETKYEQLIEIVHRDQITSTWLIMRANSAFFKLHAEIDSIDRAIQYMGFRPVCNLFLGRLLSQRVSSLDTEREKQVYAYIMQVGLGAAYLTRSLAEYVDYPHPEIAYSSVLLSQLGRLLLLDTRRDHYASLWFDESGTFVGPPPLGRETLFLSANYVTLGTEVGRQNKFSDTLLSVMRFHHRPGDVLDKKHELLAFLVATGLETYMTMTGRPMSDLLSKLLSSYPLKGTIELTGVPRRPLMAALQDMLEEARAFVDTVFTDDVVAAYAPSPTATP